MDNRKELKDKYKKMPVVGGVFSITCSGNGRVWLKYRKGFEGTGQQVSLRRLNRLLPGAGHARGVVPIRCGLLLLHRS